MKKFSRKAMLGITAGVLAVLAIIGAGTFAWFTANASVDEAEFTTAIVQLSEAEGSYGVYNFLTGKEMNINYQKLLESYTDESLFAVWLGSTNPNTEWMREDYDAANQDLDQYDKDIKAKEEEFKAAYDAWLAAASKYDGILELIDLSNWPSFPTYPSLSDYITGYEDIKFLGIVIGQRPVYDMDAYNAAVAKFGDDLNYYLVTYPAMVAQAVLELPEARRDEYMKNGTQKELQDALDKLRETAQELWDLIFSKAVFEEAELVTPGSLIYGSYTITNESNVPTYFRLSETSDVDPDIAMIKAVAFNGTYTYELEKYSDASGAVYFYSPNALAAKEEITIVIGAYIYGAANGNEVQNRDFNFGGAKVELIQASNNAVYLVDGWKDSGVAFVAYTEPVQP